MSLSKIEPRKHGLFRLHGWLLVLWASAIGLCTSAALLHLFHVHSMAVRYAVGAGAVYFVGFVWGGWWYARWWNGRRALGDRLPAHATADEQVAYDQSVDAMRKKLGKFDGLGDFFSVGDDPLSALLFVIGLIGAAVLLAFFLGYLPVLTADLLAGYLAEIVLEFVIGGLLVRRILRPRQLDQYWRFIVGKTWMLGILLVVVFGAFGAAIQYVNPAAKTLLQIFG
nr:hypothetical protein [uncultured Albidiferax sp.]